MTLISARSRQADKRLGVDALQQASRLILGEHRRLTPTHDVLGPAHRMRRVHCEHLSDDF